MNLDGDIYKNQTPNNTLMIRGLAQHITENDVSINIAKNNLFEIQNILNFYFY